MDRTLEQTLAICNKLASGEIILKDIRSPEGYLIEFHEFETISDKEINEIKNLYPGEKVLVYLGSSMEKTILI